MTRYLLDTHALLWWWTEPSLLGGAATNALSNNEDDFFVSVACLWEIAIKTQSGKLSTIKDLRRDYPALMEANGFRSLAINDEHALCGGFLPGPHRDPFDRLIAAQALIEDMTVITRDPEIAAFGCKVLW